MKAYDIPVKVTSEGELDIPPALAELLPRDQTIRIIILISEHTDSEEQAAWSRLTAEQFQAGYSEADAIYDSMN